MAFRNQETTLTLPDGAGEDEPRVVIDGESGQIRVYNATGLVGLIDETGVWAIDPEDNSHIRMAFSPTDDYTQLTFNPGVIAGRIVEDSVIFGSVLTDPNFDWTALDLFGPELDKGAENTGRSVITMSHQYDNTESEYLAKTEISSHALELTANASTGHSESGKVTVTASTSARVETGSGSIELSAGSNVDLSGINVRGQTLVSNGPKPILLGETGLTLVSWTNTQSFSVAVNFANTYANPPAVIPNFETGAGAVSQWNVRAINPTTTGFTLFGYRTPGVGNNSGTDIPVGWIAAVR